MEISAALTIVSKSLSRFFRRYHVIIFAVLALGGLTIATFMLYQLIVAPVENVDSSTSATFDNKTADRLRSLRTSEEKPATPSLPSGRTDPF